MESRIYDILTNLLRDDITKCEAIEKLLKAINYTHSCESDSELLCKCGGNERIALDCTMKPCKHPKYCNK